MSDLYERILMLKATSIFADVATDDLRVVAHELEEEPCFAGERIFDIQEPSDRAYVIQAGKVGISIQADPKAREFIATLGPGECFGEMSIFDDLPRSATAHVIEDGMLLALDKAKLRALVLRYPELALGLLRGLSLRLREANRRSK